MSWIEEQNPKLTGDPYGPTTPHIFYPSGFHYHHGMPLVSRPEEHKRIPGPDAIRITDHELTKITTAMRSKKIYQSTISRHIKRANRVVTAAFNGEIILSADEILKIKEYLGVA